MNSGRGRQGEKHMCPRSVRRHDVADTENKVQAVAGYVVGDRGRVSYAKPRNLYFILYAPGVGKK